MARAGEVATAATEAFNSHDEARIRASWIENAVLEAPDDVRLEGADDATEYAMSWLRAFPDAWITVHTQVEAGDRVVQEFTFQGTHTASLVGKSGEIPATHRQLTGRGAEIFRIEGDKVAEWHLYFDQVQVLTQLGLMPEAALA